MKTLKKIIYYIAFLAISSNAHAQSANKKTEQVQILGNCEMCKSRIEKAGSKKGEAKVNWDDKSKMATLTYDSLKQSSNDILKRIALAGYDNENFLAPDAAYSKLPDCCKYERSLKKDTMKNETAKETNETAIEASSFGKLFSDYFDLKDAFIQSDEKSVLGKASNLEKQIESIHMTALTQEQHIVWMKVYIQISELSKELSTTDKIDVQRKTFSELSKDFYELAKVAQLKYQVFYQHCPMFNNGSDWLSRESEIKNPFYGNQMLTCGKTMEILK